MNGETAAPRALSPRALSALAYLGGWATGAIVWVVEREDPRVRFHAAQAVLLFGGLTLLWFLVWTGSFVVLTVSAAGFAALQRIAQALLAAVVLAWAIALWVTWRGRDLRVPLLAGPAARIARWRARPALS